MTQEQTTQKQLHVISLGAGVQSSTMALMAARGEITPMPDCAIFADTQGEPKSVYLWLNWLCGVEVKYRENGEAYVDVGSYQSGVLPYPVLIVSKGNLAVAAATVHRSAAGKLYTNSNIPVFLKVPGQVKEGLQSRQCTSDFKIKVIQRAIRRIAKNDIAAWRAVTRWEKKRRTGRIVPIPVVQWIGFSTDEWNRVKPSRIPYIQNIHPLLNKRMSRLDCLEWMKAAGFPVPPRSACVFCPYHGDAEWLRLKELEPEEFERAAAFEDSYQAALSEIDRIKGRPFLHRSLSPLRKIDFEASIKNKADIDAQQPHFFGSECEGMCGV